MMKIHLIKYKKPLSISFITSKIFLQPIPCFQMEVPMPHLVTAAIYARQFDRDGQTRTELPFTSQAQSLPQCLFGVFALFVFLSLNMFII